MPLKAAPSGARYDRGQVSVTQSGSETIVNQSVARAVIDWQSFDVGAHESVIFNQPGRAAATLNRVTAGQESIIAGSIFAPGQVIIENSNGVVFTGCARIDVGSLIATSLGIAATNFQAGKLVFDQPGKADAVVSNSGNITVADRGLAALVAPAVANSGTITARLGTVALAAGNAVTVDLYGDGLVSVAVTEPVTHAPKGVDALIQQGGVLKADGGNVVLTANAAAGVIDNAINMNGIVQARGVASKGGQVALIGGSQGGVTVSGTIDASGAAGGGKVLIGEDLHNLIPALDPIATASSQSKSVQIAAGARIDASATGQGDGGIVVLGSEMRTGLAGVIVALGAGSGRGGVIETSSRGQLWIGSTASVRSGGGTWLLDPSSITVVASGGSAGSIGDANAASGASSIDAGVVDAALGSGAVTLQANNLIDVEAPIIAPGNGALQLIVNGLQGAVLVNAPIVLGNGALAIRAVSNLTLTDQARVNVGSGTAWLQAATNGAISESPSASIVAGALGAFGGTVDLASFANSVGVLAGSSFNGGFRFSQTNATGVTNLGTVNDPFGDEALVGVSAAARNLVGTQIFVANSPTGENNLETLTANGTPFDSVILSALPYGLLPNSPTTLPTTDSSDYVVQRFAFTLSTGSPGSWNVTPLTGAKPTGFGVLGNLGTVVIERNRWGVAGMQAPGTTDPNEVQYNLLTGASEALVYALGGRTTAITATLGQFFNPEVIFVHGADQSFVERGQAQFFQATPLTPIILTDVTPTLAATATTATEVVFQTFALGVDPDTPGDAVYRTSTAEHPFIENAFNRSYALGSVQLAPAPPASAATPAATLSTAENAHDGQHADRVAASFIGVAPVNAGGDEALAQSLAAIVTAAGPGAGPAAGPTSCGADSLLGDFWSCTFPGALPAPPRPASAATTP